MPTPKLTAAQRRNANAAAEQLKAEAAAWRYVERLDALCDYYGMTRAQITTALVDAAVEALLDAKPASIRVRECLTVGTNTRH